MVLAGKGEGGQVKGMNLQLSDASYEVDSCRSKSGQGPADSGSEVIALPV